MYIESNKKIPNHVLDQSLNKYENKQKKRRFWKKYLYKNIEIGNTLTNKKTFKKLTNLLTKKAKERNTIYLVDSDLIFENPTTTTTTKTIINKMLNVVEKKINK